MGDSILDAHADVVKFLGGPEPVVPVVQTDEELDRELDAFLPDMFARNQAPVRNHAHTAAELNVVASGSSGGILLRPRS